MTPGESSDFALEVADRLVGTAPRRFADVMVKRLFGGAGLSLGGVTFALVLRGVLHFRVDDAMRADFAARGAEPFRYSTKLRQVTVASYYEVPVEILDDDDELATWAERALAAARAVQKPKKKR
ncbi:TfoX/Sxy family protein [Zavarzinia sp.]|uniref:TfoX/Sxy family protein n=1 Tax=Zavarzinia sp. TaxID=2027920 RepID=UPI0035654910